MSAHLATPQTRHRDPHLKRLSFIAALTLGLGGCATFTPDGGMQPVAQGVASAISMDTTKITSSEDAANVQARVQALLKSPSPPTRRYKSR